MSLFLKIDPGKPDEEKLAEAVRILLEGGVAAFPTETFYDLGADARNEVAVGREGRFFCHHEDCFYQGSAPNFTHGSA